MKNITLSVPDNIYREARLTAARQDTSVSALVATLLHELATGQPRHTARAATIDAAFATVSDFAAADRLSRDQVHDRAFTRALDQRQHLLDEASPRP